MDVNGDITSLWRYLGTFVVVYGCVWVYGVATATICAMLRLECIVYMGEIDTKRQKLNVFRMNTLGATIVP